MSASSPRALIFDLGKVLIDFSVEKACAQIASAAGVTAPAVQSFLFDDGLEFEFERGSFDFVHLHSKFESHFALKIPALTLQHAASDIFSPLTESLELLAAIHAKYKESHCLLLLSNTNEIHWQHIQERWNISRWFDDVILSFEVKAMKPDLRIYEEAVRRSGSQPHECFFVDDVIVNVEGARRAGLDSVTFEGANKLRNDLCKRGIVI